jgi:hypothetical protein
LTRSLIAAGAILGVTVTALAVADTTAPAKVTIAGPVMSTPAPPPRQVARPARPHVPLSGPQLTAAKQAAAASFKLMGASGGGPKPSWSLSLDPSQLTASASAGAVTGTMRGMHISMPDLPKTWLIDLNPQQPGEVLLHFASVTIGDMLLLNCTLDDAYTPHVQVTIKNTATQFHDELVNATHDFNGIAYAFKAPAPAFEVVLVPKSYNSSNSLSNTYFTGCTLYFVPPL